LKLLPIPERRKGKVPGMGDMGLPGVDRWKLKLCVSEAVEIML